MNQSPLIARLKIFLILLAQVSLMSSTWQRIDPGEEKSVSLPPLPVIQLCVPWALSCSLTELAEMRSINQSPSHLFAETEAPLLFLWLFRRNFSLENQGKSKQVPKYRT